MLDHFDHSQTFNGKANRALRPRDYLDRLFTIFLYLTCSKYSNAGIVTKRKFLYSSRFKICKRYVNVTVVFKVESKACAGSSLFPEKDLDPAK